MRRPRDLASALLAAFAALTLAVSVVLAVHVWRNGPDRPLGPYPLQTVVHKVLHVGETQIAEGVLCNKTKHDLNVLTTLSWQGLNPDGTPRTGTFVNIGVDIPQIRKAGCQPFDRAHGTAFTNPMPSAVIDASRSLLAQDTRPFWRVVGFEIAVRGADKFSERTSFATEPFEVVP